MKVLFICDQKDDWEYFGKLFAGNFHKLELRCAIKGDDAVDMLMSEGTFSFYVIDAALKNEEPISLAEKLYDVSGECPIIFIGEKHIINSRLSNDFFLKFEFNEILEKPFEPSDFVDIVIKVLDWAKQDEYESSIKEMDIDELVPMKIRNFFLFSEIGYDVYLQVNRNKYTHIIQKNEPYTHSMLNTYVKKNIKFLYLAKDDHLKFLDDSVDTLIELIYATQEFKKTQHKKVLNILCKSVVTIHQYIRTVGITDKIILLITKVIDHVYNHYNSIKSFDEVLENFPVDNFGFAEHSVLTFYYCQALCDGMGWKSDMTRKKLGLASILQDATLENEDLIKIQSLEDTNFQSFSDSDQEAFRNHPKDAAQLASYFQGFPDTDFIIAQHHERPTGNGFPAGLNASKITAISCTFIISNYFAARVLAGGLKKEVILEVYNFFKTVFSTGNFKAPLLALGKVK